MSTKPIISVIIPAYNAAESIAAAVNSALSQTYRPVEILVIDDGSTDKTLQVAKSFGDHIRVLHQPNAGPSAARNLGLQQSRGELIAFLDADDRWHPDKLELQQQLFTLHPEVGLVHTDVTHFDPRSKQEWQREVGRKHFVGECFELLLQQNRILTSSVVMRREYLNQIGDFDKRFKGVEDYDLWLRLASCCQFAYIDRPLVWYCHQSGSLSSHSAAMRMGELEVVQSAIDRLRHSETSVHRTPSIQRKLSQRLQALNWDIGYDAYQQGSYKEARRHLGSSLRYRPLDFYAAFLWCSTWLPGPVIARLKSLKARRRQSKSAMAGIDA